MFVIQDLTQETAQYAPMVEDNNQQIPIKGHYRDRTRKDVLI